MSMKKRIIGTLCVVTLIGGSIVVFKANAEKNDEKPAYNLSANEEIITFEEQYTTIFNRVEGALKNKTSIVFAEQEDTVQVKDSLSEKEYMIVSAKFRYKYSIGLERWSFGYDPEIDKFILSIPREEIMLDSIEQLGSVETIKHVKEGWEKIKEHIPFVESSDLELKDKVLNKLESEKDLGKQVVYEEGKEGIYYKDLEEKAINALVSIKNIIDPEGDQLEIKID